MVVATMTVVVIVGDIEDVVARGEDVVGRGAAGSIALLVRWSFQQGVLLTKDCSTTTTSFPTGEISFEAVIVVDRDRDGGAVDDRTIAHAGKSDASGYGCGGGGCCDRACRSQSGGRDVEPRPKRDSRVEQSDEEEENDLERSHLVSDLCSDCF